MLLKYSLTPCSLCFRDHCSASFALPVLRGDGVFGVGLAEGDAASFSLVEDAFDESPEGIGSHAGDCPDGS